jgi:DNA repair exonuclease SbcCD ATPase subunit
MAPRTLAGLSAALCAAQSVADAFVLLSREVVETDRAATVALYEYDQHRAVLCRRILVENDAAALEALEVSLDHLPAHVRRSIRESKQFVELGPQSDDYMKLLGFPVPAEGGAFLLRGFAMDGDLVAVLALHEPKRVFGTRLSERLSPPADLFALSVERLAERDARHEATTRLEELTRRLHEEHQRVIGDLERRLQQARAAASGGGSEADERISGLQRTADTARLEARATAQRLSAVEEQVTSAAGRLEKAHRQLHEQSEAIRQQRNLLYRIERMLRDAAGADSEKLIQDLLAVVSPSPAPLERQ